MLKKLAASAIGCMVVLGGIEISIRVADYFGQAAQEKMNRHAMENGEIRILAIGESTTAIAGDADGRMLVPSTAYPLQLEEILNSRQDKFKFRVFNGGINSGNSHLILASLPDMLERYKPHIVISMMGMKDQPRTDAKAASEPWLRSLKLLAWLKEELWMKLNADRLTRYAGLPRSDDSPYRSGWLTKVRETLVLDMRGAIQREIRTELGRGLFLWNSGRHDEGVNHLRYVTATYKAGYGILARALQTEGRSEEAVQVMREAMNLQPEEGMHGLILAELLMELGDFKEAERSIKQVRANLPSYRYREVISTYLPYFQARLYFWQKNFTAAIGEIKALEKINSDIFDKRLARYFPDPEWLLYSSLGEIYYHMGRYKDAEAELEKAHKLFPQGGPILWLLYSTYRKTGHPEKAIALQAEQDDPEFVRLAVYYEIARSLYLMGQGSKVPIMFQEAATQLRNLRENYKSVHQLLKERDIKLFVMQYPQFDLDLMKNFSPSAPDISYISNEKVFDPDPEKFFFEPRYPYSFTHYTREGARKLAENVAEHILPYVNSRPHTISSRGDR